MANTTYRDYKLQMLAGVMQQINVRGDYWEIQECSADGAITLSFDDGNSIKRYAGQGGPGYYSAQVQITSAVDQTVTISLGYINGATPYSSRATFSGSVSATVAIASVATPITDVTIPAGASAALTTADATRLTTTVRVPDDASGNIRIGDSSVSATTGLILEPGDAASIDGTAAIYAYNLGATNTALSILTTSKP